MGVEKKNLHIKTFTQMFITTYSQQLKTGNTDVYEQVNE